MERGPRHKEVGKLPRLKRRTQPDNLDEQVQALRRFQSLPGFVDGIRAARRRDRGGVLVRLVATAGRAASRVVAAMRNGISRMRRSPVGTQGRTQLKTSSGPARPERRR